MVEKYVNVMGLTMFNEGQEEILSSLRGIWRNLQKSKNKKCLQTERNVISVGKTLVVIIVAEYAKLQEHFPPIAGKLSKGMNTVS
jgi:hypothetical protein